MATHKRASDEQAIVNLKLDENILLFKLIMLIGLVVCVFAYDKLIIFKI